MKLAGIVLAAGSSQRFSGCKLLAEIQGKSLIEIVVSSLLDSGYFETILLVSGRYQEILEIPVIKTSKIHKVHNLDHLSGMGTSIRCALSYLRKHSLNINGIALFLGDLPFIKPETIKLLTHSFFQHPDKIIIPYCNGMKGHPVIFPEKFFSPLEELDGETGARDIIKANPQDILKIQTEDTGIFRDIDTREDWKNAEEKFH